ncbi:MAG TPA: hypothetical protein H9836_08655 [Candidatus Nocardiopsis merdipullorum]|nr:hypothetical protein [Candidatus Nocardiopsis merdipullorum]
MIRIGITGHRALTPQVSELVADLIRAHLAPYGCEMTGMSCLADGADALFAKTVVDTGAPLEVIVPAGEYRAGLPAEHRPTYDHLLEQAVLVHELPHTASTPQAHMAAGRFLVERCDQLVAVWDGEPARGPGGTADIVAHARSRHKPVSVLWPAGVRR